MLGINENKWKLMHEYSPLFFLAGGEIFSRIYIGFSQTDRHGKRQIDMNVSTEILGFWKWQTSCASECIIVRDVTMLEFSDNPIFCPSIFYNWFRYSILLKNLNLDFNPRKKMNAKREYLFLNFGLLHPANNSATLESAVLCYSMLKNFKLHYLD